MHLTPLGLKINAELMQDLVAFNDFISGLRRWLHFDGNAPMCVQAHAC
jgi:hypothetical protein